jgi:hypothetical protein
MPAASPRELAQAPRAAVAAEPAAGPRQQRAAVPVAAAAQRQVAAAEAPAQPAAMGAQPQPVVAAVAGLPAAADLVAAVARHRVAERTAADGWRHRAAAHRVADGARPEAAAWAEQPVGRRSALAQPEARRREHPAVGAARSSAAAHQVDGDAVASPRAAAEWRAVPQPEAQQPPAVYRPAARQAEPHPALRAAGDWRSQDVASPDGGPAAAPPPVVRLEAVRRRPAPWRLPARWRPVECRSRVQRLEPRPAGGRRWVPDPSRADGNGHDADRELRRVSVSRWLGQRRLEPPCSAQQRSARPQDWA